METCVSVFSISPSLILLEKCFGYWRLRYPSPMARQTERDDLRTWSVKAYFSSGGNDLGEFKNNHGQLESFFINRKISEITHIFRFLQLIL